MKNESTMISGAEEGARRRESFSILTLPQEDDHLAIQQATAEARQALAEAVVAVAMATDRALASVRRLDEALAGVNPTAPYSRLGERGELLEAVRVVGTISRLAGAEVALSHREREVLALIAEGYSNKAIAKTLFVSPNTVKTHVASLLTKLRADSRVQLAAIATRHAFAEQHRSPSHRLDDAVLASKVPALGMGVDA